VKINKLVLRRDLLGVEYLPFMLLVRSQIYLSLRSTIYPIIEKCLPKCLFSVLTDMLVAKLYQYFFYYLSFHEPDVCSECQRGWGC